MIKKSANILQKISGAIDMNEDLFQDEFNRYNQKIQLRNSYKKNNKLNAKTKKKSKISTKTYFWGVILKFFPECKKLFTLIDPCFFSIPHEKELYSFLHHAYTKGVQVSMREKFSTLPDDFREEIMKSMLFVDHSLGVLTPKQREPYIDNLIKSIGNDCIKNMKKEILANPTPENLKNFQKFPEFLNRFK